jgi:hypothetical protein
MLIGYRRAWECTLGVERDVWVYVPQWRRRSAKFVGSIRLVQWKLKATVPVVSLHRLKPTVGEVLLRYVCP